MSVSSVVDDLVRAVLAARRELWSLVFPRDVELSGAELPLEAARVLEWEARLVRALTTIQNDHGLTCTTGGVSLLDGSTGAPKASAQLLKTHELLRRVLRGYPELRRTRTARRLRADTAYLVWRNIRQHHGVLTVSDVAQVFRTITDQLRLLAAGNGESSKGMAFTTFLHRVENVNSRYLDLFADVALSLEDVDRGFLRPSLQLRIDWLDPEYLASCLFGLRTSIRGFDTLFEGGLRLAENTQGRVVLVRGPFGCAKSILALSLAVEVARKGGKATVIPLDDTIDALETYLVSFGLTEALPIRDVPAEPHGALGLIYAPETRNGLPEFTRQVREFMPALGQKDLLSVLVVDPINRLQHVAATTKEVRECVVELVAETRARGTNLVLVVETEDGSHQNFATDSPGWLEELPFIADTVIDLCRDRVHGYDQRFIQVSKSRFQRERRGRHPICVVSGSGLAVAPASSAIVSELTRRSAPVADACEGEVDFGWPEFSSLIGSVQQGDSLVFRGPQGSLKTLVALRFLSQPRSIEADASGMKRRSLFLTDRSHRPLQAYYDAYRIVHPAEDRVTLKSFPSGYVQPGRILLDFQSHFANARDQNILYDRVVFANAGRWDLNCPFIRSDPGFGEALLQLFRREGATVIFVCAEREAERDSSLQYLLVDRASTLVDFERVEYRGAQRVLCRTVRTTSTPRARDWHEATIHGGHLRLSPSLLRLRETGGGSPPEVYEVKTKLHLYRAKADEYRARGDERSPKHQESAAQASYLKSVRRRLESVLAAPVILKSLGGAILTDAVQLAPLSAGSDLDILQVDEFQLPVLKRAMLHPFRRSLLDGPPAAATAGTGVAAKDEPMRWPLWDDLSKDVRDMISLEEGEDLPKHIVAVPYYRNLGLLTVQKGALQQGILRPTDFKDWDSLRQAAERARRKRLSRAFFDFSRRVDEDFVCLFLEMALGYGDHGFPAQQRGLDGLREWIQSKGFADALRCFHALCSPVCQRSRVATPGRDEKRTSSAATPALVTASSALITRQWYTNLTAPGATSGECMVRQLPGDVSLSGEWYLGVSAHSAVPDIGFHIILDELASTKGEWARLRMGIGLPVTPQFYAQKKAQSFFPPNLEISPELDLRSLTTNAKRRSQIYQYHLFGPVLAKHLRDMLIPKAVAVDETVERLLTDTNVVLGRRGPLDPIPKPRPGPGRLARASRG